MAKKLNEFIVTLCRLDIVSGPDYARNYPIKEIMRVAVRNTRISKGPLASKSNLSGF